MDKLTESTNQYEHSQQNLDERVASLRLCLKQYVKAEREALETAQIKHDEALAERRRAEAAEQALSDVQQRMHEQEKCVNEQHRKSLSSLQLECARLHNENTQLNSRVESQQSALQSSQDSSLIIESLRIDLREKQRLIDILQQNQFNKETFVINSDDNKLLRRQFAEHSQHQKKIRELKREIKNLQRSKDNADILKLKLEDTQNSLSRMKARVDDLLEHELRVVDLQHTLTSWQKSCESICGHNVNIHELAQYVTTLKNDISSANALTTDLKKDAVVAEKEIQVLNDIMNAARVECTCIKAKNVKTNQLLELAEKKIIRIEADRIALKTILREYESDFDSSVNDTLLEARANAAETALEASNTENTQLRILAQEAIALREQNAKLSCIKHKTI